MKCSVIRKKIMKLLTGVLCLTAIWGCAADQSNLKKDPFFEKWSVLADESKGHTPAHKPKKIDISALTARSDLRTDVDERKLPNRKINLTMRQADLKSVLRAMARSVDLNLLVKNELKIETTVDFRGVEWDKAFSGLLRTYNLSYVWEGDIIRVMTAEDVDLELKKKMSIRDLRQIEPLLQPVLISIDYADAKKLQKTLQEFLTKDKDGKPRGSVDVDEHSNSLVISAIREDLRRMLPIIEEIDKPTAQILIRANIVETTKDMARDLGIMWGGMYKTSVQGDSLWITPGGTGTATRGQYNPTVGGPRGIGGEGFGVNFPASGMTTSAAGSLGLIFGNLGASLLEVQLQALQKDNKLNILSSPSITTLDNQKAFTENGEKVPYVTYETTSGSATPTKSVKFEDVVLRLEITPHVIDGRNLKMTINVKKDEVDLTRSVEGNPFIIKKQTSTVLVVKDGETIVISGLTKQKKAAAEAGWPWLKDVPVLGWLFKSDTKKDVMEEVIIFITPHILPVAHSAPQPVSIKSDSVLPEAKKGEQSGSRPNAAVKQEEGRVKK